MALWRRFNSVVLFLVCKPLVGSSNLSAGTNIHVSIPVTSLTIYIGHIADTLALKGLGAHSTQVH